MNNSLDKKDYRILAELDLNFRQPFSKIGKSVGLSKGSTALRFLKLQNLMSHNITGINYMALGYRMVKVFYSLVTYNEKIEREIVEETKRNRSIFWAARLFGNYDLEICLLVRNIDEIITQMERFEKRLAGIIKSKDILLMEREFYKKYSFLHEKNSKVQMVNTSDKTISLTNTEKKILLILMPSPRETLLEISRKSGLTPKTVSNNIKQLEKKGIIYGYFLSLKLANFNYEVYKLLIQTQNAHDLKEFEEYLTSIPNMKHLSKIMGKWNYELDVYAENLYLIHMLIDNLKNKFGKTIGRVDIITHGKRLVTNKEGFLR